jgi:hypothetical protein
MIDEKKLAELRKAYASVVPLGASACMVEIEMRDFDDMAETLEALWKVARTGSNIEDLLQVPPLLGDTSHGVMAKAILDFREALAALKEKS